MEASAVFESARRGERRGCRPVARAACGGPHALRRARGVGVALLALLALVGASAPGAEAFVYWANQNGTIGRASLDGTGVNENFITGTNLGAIAVDAAHVYWTTGGTTAADTSIGRANLDGTGANQRFITGTSFPFWVAVGAGHVYWTNQG